MKKLSKKTIVLLLCLGFVLSLVIYNIWGNLTIQTDIFEIPLSEKHSALSGFTIVQISDLHNAAFGENQEKLLRSIQKQSPDIIAITGDLIDSEKTDVETAMILIREAIKIAPIYYVTGNHEAWARDDYENLRKQLLAAGVTVLENKTAEILYEEETLVCIGVNDPDFTKDSADVGDAVIMEKTLSELHESDDRFTLLLSHRPELFETYAENGANLVLSGHAHGGQFRLPFLGGLIAPDQGLFPKYTSGVFSKDTTHMVVSRGLGNSIIPIRIFNRPELVVIKLI